MLVRVCDRCGVPVGDVPASVSVTLAADAPATKPRAVTEPFTVAAAVQFFTNTGGPSDLCGICRASVVRQLLPRIGEA